MKKEIRDKLKLKQIELLIQTQEYSDLLKEVSDDIYQGSKNAENEASIVSIFELELFSFIKTILGLKYYSKKEIKVNTIRHISNDLIW